jgi:predicted transposase YbfD/YdcC
MVWFMYGISTRSMKSRLHFASMVAEENLDESTIVTSLLCQVGLAGCIVTVEAVETQKGIARQIIQQNSEYVIAIRENQQVLYKEVQKIFALAKRNDFAQIQHQFHQVVQCNIDGLVKSQYWIVDDPNYIRYLDPKGEWEGLRGIGMAQLIWEIDSRESQEVCYYLLSFGDDVKKFAEAVKTPIGTVKLTFIRG